MKDENNVHVHNDEQVKMQSSVQCRDLITNNQQGRSMIEMKFVDPLKKKQKSQLKLESIKVLHEHRN